MIKLMQGDCLERMKEIPDGSIDAIICDPPYGTTACRWDTVIDLDLMWIQLKRIIKPNGAIVLFGSEPFSSALRMSNIKQFKYDWVWEKSRVSHFAQAPYRPLTVVENISCFSFGGNSKNARIRMKYNPQGTKGCNKICKGKGHSDHRPSNITQKNYKQTVTNYPKQILKFKSDAAKLHPTQKPVDLMEYLIKTYTNKNDTVLDFCLGSGTAGVAARNLNRNFIGIELDENYFNIAKERINGIKQEKPT